MMNRFYSIHNLDKEALGVFYPHMYALGLSTSLEETFESFRDYPVDDKTFLTIRESFNSCLTYFHEINHLALYTGTLWGARIMRSFFIVIKALSKHNIFNNEGSNITLPYIKMNLKEILSDDYLFQRILFFIDGFYQLHTTPFINHDSIILEENELIRIQDVFTAPICAFLPNLINSQDLIKRTNHIPKKIPVLHIKYPEHTCSVPITLSLLLENAAKVTEYHHLSSLNPKLGAHESIELLFNTFNEYTILLHYLLYSGICTTQNLFLTYSVLVDIALNYEPSILYGSPTITFPEGKVADRYPGDTFILLVNSAKNVKPIQSWNDVSRYYNELCLEAKLPSPEEIVKLGSDNLKKLADNDSVLVHTEVYKVHYNSFIRRVKDPFVFASSQHISKFLIDTTLICGKLMSVFNISKKQPEIFDPKNLFFVIISDFVRQIVFENRIECPLKRGYPFRCPSSNKSKEHLCAFKVTAENESENAGNVFACIIDDLANDFRLSKYLAH